MRYHPDTRDTGDESRFSEIVEAHNTLKDPVKCARQAPKRYARAIVRSRFLRVLYQLLMRTPASHAREISSVLLNE
ncbi:hypothetical protein [Mesorhizobium abyssinicae]|uniref:hypothetical protein n=1 Tax=Mesorhizobium abyssinicae TaxID=1209958 RepID=UPI00387DC496